jgi:hypothetical protein
MIDRKYRTIADRKHRAVRASRWAESGGPFRRHLGRPGWHQVLVWQGIDTNRAGCRESVKTNKQIDPL